MQVRYRYVYEDRDRHGNVRIYFWRRPGTKVRIREQPGTEDFSRRYHALLAGEAGEGGERAASGLDRPQPGTLRWLVAGYVASSTARALDPDTQRVRRQILEHCCREPIAPGRAEVFGDMPADRLSLKALAVLRDRKLDLPEAANGRVKALKALLKWAKAAELVRTDHARELKHLKTAGGGFPAWTEADVAAFEARHPVGTKARLALAILLYTGMRRSDAVELGRQHVKAGWISKPMFKGRNRHAQRIEIPMLQPLADIIAASETGDLAFLATQAGRPFTIAGFGNWFRDRCDEAGLKGKSAHGLRKAGATRAAEAGASSQMLMAMFGWKSLSHAELYTRSADRKRLSAEGMALLLPNVPTASEGGEDRAENTANSTLCFGDGAQKRGARG